MCAYTETCLVPNQLIFCIKSWAPNPALRSHYSMGIYIVQYRGSKWGGGDRSGCWKNVGK